MQRQKEKSDNLILDNYKAECVWIYRVVFVFIIYVGDYKVELFIYPSLVNAP
jgi:hypothetical protein